MHGCLPGNRRLPILYNEYYSQIKMILITKLLLSTGGHGLSKLAVGILVLLGICAVGLYIIYPLSTGNDRGTLRNDVMHGTSTIYNII